MLTQIPVVGLYVAVEPVNLLLTGFGIGLYVCMEVIL